jgi:hypothetical protein
MINLMSATSDGPFQPRRVQFVTENGYTINMATYMDMENEEGRMQFDPSEISIFTTSSMAALRLWKDDDLQDKPKVEFVTDIVARRMGRGVDGYIMGVSGLADVMKVYRIVDSLPAAN